jgi:F-box-like
VLFEEADEEEEEEENERMPDTEETLPTAGCSSDSGRRRASTQSDSSRTRRRRRSARRTASQSVRSTALMVGHEHSERRAASGVSAAHLDLEHDYTDSHRNARGVTAAEQVELMDLPPEILLHIVSLLDAPSVCKLASASCFFAQLCSLPCVWRRFLHETDLACMVKNGTCARRVRPEEYRQILLHRPKKVFNIFSMISLPQPWMISFCLPCTEPSPKKKGSSYPLRRKGSWLTQKRKGKGVTMSRRCVLCVCFARGESCVGVSG